MNKRECETEKLSSRAVGIVLLPVAMMLGFLGFLMLPVVGLFFSVPLFALSFMFIAAPESETCRLMLRRGA